MCGRYVIEIDEPSLREIVAEAQKRLEEGKLKTGEIYPTNIAPVLVAEGERIIAKPMVWGFPKWDGKGVIINARAESAAEKKMFKAPLQRQRVAVPTSGFFEWKHAEDARKKDKYLFRKPDSNILYLAGIYNDFSGKECFNILTTSANSSMAEYHNRMPVLLGDNECETWLRDTDIVPMLLSRTPIALEAKLIQ